MSKTIIGLPGLKPFETSFDWKYGSEEIIRCGHNPVMIEIRREDGSIDRQITANLVTNVGLDFICNQIGNSNVATSTNVAKYMGISADVTSPLVTDIVLAGEITSNGLGRKPATYGHTNGTAIFTQQVTWDTITGVQNGISKMALFTAITGGVMIFETMLAVAKSVSNSDSLTVTWTGNIN